MHSRFQTLFLDNLPAVTPDVTLVIVKLPAVNAPAELIFKITLRSATTNSGWIKLTP